MACYRAVVVGGDPSLESFSAPGAGFFMIISQCATQEPGQAPPPTRRGPRHPAQLVVAKETVR
jgi:hypothetical protein